MSDKLKQSKKLLKDAEAAFKKVKTYSAVIHCQDRIKGKLRKPEKIKTYFARPYSVYLCWLPGPYKGLQVSHVNSRDGKNKFRARETGVRGMAGTVTWKADSAIIDKMYPHHFRPHETSLDFLLSLTSDIMKRAEKMGKVEVTEIKELTDEFIGRKATRIVSVLSDDPADDLRWPKAEFYFDHETSLPLHFKLYDFDGGLFGEYAFTEFKANADLPGDAFEIKKL